VDGDQNIGRTVRWGSRRLIALPEATSLLTGSLNLPRAAEIQTEWPAAVETSACWTDSRRRQVADLKGTGMNMFAMMETSAAPCSREDEGRVVAPTCQCETTRTADAPLIIASTWFRHQQTSGSRLAGRAAGNLFGQREFFPTFFGSSMMNGGASSGTFRECISRGDADPRLPLKRYDPGHPDAAPTDMLYPDINPLTEMWTDGDTCLCLNGSAVQRRRA